MTRIAFQTAIRSAAVTLLTDYAASASVRLQVYPGRPRTINPPCAFIDSLEETIDYSGPQIRQRTPTARVVVLHGEFDSKDTAAQRDAFVDSFLDWVTDRVHAAGANTTLGMVRVTDEPAYVSDWQPEDVRRIYYATLISLEGFSPN